MGMKYVISESRLNRFMKSYLDTFVESNVVVNMDSYIIISQKNNDHIVDGEWVDWMEYDHSDGRFWVNKKFLRSFMDLFGLSDGPAMDFLASWFEDKFSVKIFNLAS